MVRGRDSASVRAERECCIMFGLLLVVMVVDVVVCKGIVLE